MSPSFLRGQHQVALGVYIARVHLGHRVVLGQGFAVEGRSGGPVRLGRKDLVAGGGRGNRHIEARLCAAGTRRVYAARRRIERLPCVPVAQATPRSIRDAFRASIRSARGARGNGVMRRALRQRGRRNQSRSNQPRPGHILRVPPDKLWSAGSPAYRGAPSPAGRSGNGRCPSENCPADT